MTPNERKLNQLLRTVSETGPQEAPAHVEEALRAAFRERRTERRSTRWAALAIAAGVGAVAVTRLSQGLLAPPAKPAVAAVQPDTSEFIALADADVSAPLEHATIVRVQLPLSAFRDIGLAINEQNAAVRVQADILLGQDGLARAVRFVQ